MYNLHLTPEQLEFRDTVRDFVVQEIKPVVLHPDHLQKCDGRLPLELLDKASQMGLRTLMLSEELGGAGADNLTACLVAEELGAGDIGIAVTLGQTWTLAHFLFDQAMTPAQRTRYLPAFMADERYHLAYAALQPDPDLGWKYHRPFDEQISSGVTAARQDNGDWVLNGVTGFVANAPVARLIAVQIKAGPARPGVSGVETLLIARDTPGLEVREPHEAGRGSGPGGEPVTKWYHGTGGELVFKDCRVAAENLLAHQGASPFAAELAGRGNPQTAAMNVGIGRAAYEAAVDYAKLRVQGARPIIQHQAIGTILAKVAIKLEVARNMIRQAAWASDHPEAYADRSLSDLPLQTIATVFASEVIHEVSEEAAECFGAMGVMLDMPLPKYVHEARIFLHSGDSNSVATLRIAEAVAGYRRSAGAGVKAAA